MIKYIKSWYSNHKLETPYAIVIAALIIAVGLLISVRLSPKEIWAALAAIGTICVVCYAVYREEYLIIRRRPVLNISFFESTPPHIIEIPEVNQETEEKSKGYYVTLKITNIGKSIAGKTQIMITAKGQYFYEDGWKTQDDWIPVSIRWILDEWTQRVEGKPTEERDLIPERPYFLHILGISSHISSAFRIYPIIIPRHQSDKYVPGIYCFEITAFALGIRTVKKYIYVEWKDSDIETSMTIPERLIVNIKDSPPW